MGEVTLQLLSSQGDRLGHLVRGVHMLTSYGKEFALESVSDVVEVHRTGEPVQLRVLVSGQTDLDADGLRQLCQEDQWSLGAEGERSSVPDALSVRPVGGFTPDPGETGPSLTPPATKPVMGEVEFLALCGWGQQGAQVAGQRPSPSGEPV